MICRTLAAHPALDITVEISQGLVDPIREGFDIAFVAVETELPDSGTIAGRIWHVERGLVAAPSLAASLPAQMHPEDLEHADAGHARRLGRGSSRAMASASRCRSARACRPTTPNCACEAALAGLGIARVPMTAAETEIAQGRLVRVMPDYPLPPLRCFALLPDRRLQPRKVRAFMEAIDDR